jgi:hypothetical protein
MRIISSLRLVKKNSPTCSSSTCLFPKSSTDQGICNIPIPLPTTTGPDSDMAHLRSHAVQYSGQMEGLMDFNDNTQSHTQGHPMPYSTPHMTPGFCAQQSPMSQPPSHQQYMQGHNMVPPTPNSIEMHGNTARYPQRVDETPDMYDGYSRINEEQVSSDKNTKMNLLANE